jgi:small subunit ribosomal protein S6
LLKKGQEDKKEKQKQMSKQYEAIFILTPVLSDEQTKEAVNSYKKLIKELNAKIVHEESWGLKKLAYSIKKKNTGYYHLMQIEAPGEAIPLLETAYKRDERVLRYLTVHLDKYALQYAERRKGKLANKKTDRKEEVTA